MAYFDKNVGICCKCKSVVSIGQKTETFGLDRNNRPVEKFLVWSECRCQYQVIYHDTDKRESDRVFDSLLKFYGVTWNPQSVHEPEPTPQD